jgi:hypothetical protein
MKPIIIGLSGKKQSGKNTVCESVKKYFNDFYQGSGSIYIYSFADALKQYVCMGMMGLSHDQCFGNDEQKNTLTAYKWENLPHQIRYDNKLGCEYAPNGEVCHFILPTGYMTARHIMQVVGTDIFRKYFDPNIHVKATFRIIEQQAPVMALISDARFPSEVQSVIEENGLVIRLTRNSENQDPHLSETALDDYDWNQWGKKVKIIDNASMTVSDQAEEAIHYIISEGVYGPDRNISS